MDFANVFYLVGTTAIYSFFITIPQYWLKVWTESGGGTTFFYVCGYMFFSVMSWSMTSAQAWYVQMTNYEVLVADISPRSVLVRLAPQSGSRIHQRLLDIVTGSVLPPRE
jgi:ATP-binding cassette, subfamily C (CFTR/MRP), member 1